MDSVSEYPMLTFLDYTGTSAGVVAEELQEYDCLMGDPDYDYLIIDTAYDPGEYIYFIYTNTTGYKVFVRFDMDYYPFI
jgi:hypothetical protein